jgi:hypothetical protein
MHGATASALLVSINEWFINMERGINMFNISAFLDLRKAFERNLTFHGFKPSAILPSE